MAIFHLHVKNISRGDGRSVVAAAAYRAGEVLRNDQEECQSAFGGKRDVIVAEIRLPSGAPDWMADRERLWNAVEAREKRKDSRLAKEIECALPRELPHAEALFLVRQFADMYTSAGHVIDLAIHDDPAAGNPHVHFLLTLRTAGEEGFADKIKSADTLQFVTAARASWASLVNAALGKVGAGVEVDHRSLKAQGIEKAPTTHRGPDRAERLRRRARQVGERVLPVAWEPAIDQEDTRSHPGPEHRPHEGASRRERQEGMADSDKREAGELQARLARLRELSQEEAGRAYPALLDAALALSSGDEKAARAALDRAEASIGFEDDLRPVPDPNGNLISAREQREAEDRMLAAVEHDNGPGAEARAAQHAQERQLRNSSKPAYPWQQGPDDWLAYEVTEGLKEIEAERASKHERDRELDRERGRGRG